MIDWNKINGGFLAPDYIPFEERNKDEMINELNCEVNRLNNIINEIEKEIERERMEHWAPSPLYLTELLGKIKQLKESGNND